MIRLTTLLLGLILIQSVTAQTTVENDQSNSSKFHIGIHFATLQYTLEMQSLKRHSIWGGTDFGTDELNDEEIAEINSYVDYEKRISGPFIEAGMIFLNKAGKPFYIDGKILLGIGMKKYKVYNSISNNTEMEVKSNKINPWLGISFNIKYNFNENWGIKLTPLVSHSWGTSSEVDDKLYPIIQAFSEKREDKSSFWYYRAELMASYSFKSFSFSAGPGFYYMTNEHEYRIERTDPDSGKTYLDVITSSLISRYFIDAGIGFKWEISDHFTFSTSAAYANDLYAWIGVNYNF